MKKLLIILLLFTLTASAAPIMPDDLLEVVCVRVVDGDTAWFEDVDEYVVHKVRFIGIDTPETVHPDMPEQPFGKEASAFTTATLLGQTAYLEYDIEPHDRYDRHLCYVWLEDGTLFNLALIEQGYATLMTYPPNVKYVDYFVAGQKAAREQRLGLWAASD